MGFSVWIAMHCIMATGRKEPLGTRVEPELKEQVEEYQQQSDAASLSEATREIVVLGLREKQGPVTHRLRDMALDAAFHLALVAVVVVIVGGATSALAPGDAMRIALVTLSVAVAPPAAVELLRLARGQSDLADLLGGGTR